MILGKSCFNEDVIKMAKEDPLRTLTLFLKYNFPINDKEFEYIVKEAESFDYFKTHKILIEYKKEKLDTKAFEALLDSIEREYDGSYTQMLLLLEIGKQYIEENPSINLKNNPTIKRLIKLSPICVNFLELPDDNCDIPDFLKDNNDIEVVASLLKDECINEKGFEQIKTDLLSMFNSKVSENTNNCRSGFEVFDNKKVPGLLRKEA